MKKNSIKVIFAGLLVSFTVSGGFILNNELKYVNVDGTRFELNNVESSLIKYLKDTVHIFNRKDFDDFIIFDVDVSKITDRPLMQRLLDLFKGKTFNLSYSYSFDIDAISSYIDELNDTAELSKNAYIVKDNNCFKLIQEVYGDFIDKDTLISKLVSSTKSINIEDYYETPSVVSDDLLDDLEELNNLSSWFCKYTDGTVIKASPDYVSYDNGNISIDTDWISQAIKDNLKSYNTVGIEREFTTNSGEVIKVSNGTWGSSVDIEAETEFLIDAFRNGISLDEREPEFSQNYEEIGSTYIEVSIDEQHVWVYKDGSLVMETDCVTGDLSKGHDTPVGIYFISERISGKYLRGDGYKTWVNKWMRLTNRGHGLHDATWRSSFGGNIYTYDGSHGCINLPKKFAYDLYDVTYRGMPVIIY